MKFRRSGRLVDLTNYLLTHPHELIPLTFFSERYESAKSSKVQRIYNGLRGFCDQVYAVRMIGEQNALD
ncbi:hypothetical protein DRA43_31415 [Micromonospora provocatoris]|nr:hypothetical protein DRA43_31415 [Micromonospora provocatoris]